MSYIYKNKPIKSYKDLDVYNRSYDSMLLVIKQILPKLPESEKFDLKNQLSRSTKAIPRLIAEDFAKKHQKSGFQKYLADAMAESNETQVGLCQCRDLYDDLITLKLCNALISQYETISKQVYKLEEAWNKF